MAELFVGGLLDPSKHERTGEDVRLETADFTTHGVIVGMTGSGKTGLGVVLIEEVLSSGVPALLIDPKGDLTNLCLTFPDLAPASFRPWIDEGQAKAAGQTPDDFAAGQATAWRDGLAAWGYGTDQIRKLRDSCDFTIYTPGSQAGAAINIVGSLQAPDTPDSPDTAGVEVLHAETIGDEIEGYVSGLLGLVDIDADPLSSREHILLANLIHHAWSTQQTIDLATLVGQVQQPPINKLGVFEIDQFFPAKDRLKLAVQLNGLLASPAFAAWGAGAPLDIQTLLFTSDQRPRCAIVTTAHLSDEERQFVTSLVLSKLVTWMRRQSGTTDLRALLYMDEVAGYLPPTAMPPTKKPIMTLMKQARAFGVGVVLATQNPVDIDYKAISNAGTWMVGRLQTERDKNRLLDGMSAADGGVDIGAVSDTISGLAKREFVLRRAGKDEPDVFTTRWAMSYLRGPMTRDQIKQLAGDPAPTEGLPAVPTAATADADRSESPSAEPAAPTGDATATSGPGMTSAPAAAPAAADTTPVMPLVAAGIMVRWVDPAATWLADVGGDATGSAYEPAIVAKVLMRYDETKADLVHDEQYGAILFPLDRTIDASRVANIALEDRNLLVAAPPGAAYRLTSAPISEPRTWKQVERDLIDHLVRVGSIELQVNKQLKLYSVPGETVEDFQTRCARAAQAAIDAARSDLQAEYSTKQSKLLAQRDAAEDRAAVVAAQAKERKRGNWLRAAGDVLGGVFGSGRSAATKIGRAADRLTRDSDGERVDEAQGKIGRIDTELADLDAALVAEITDVESKWSTAAATTTTLAVSLERTDVKVTQLALAWVPVP